VLDLLGNRRGEMAEWSMAVVLKVMQGWEGHQLFPIPLSFATCPSAFSLRAITGQLPRQRRTLSDAIRAISNTAYAQTMGRPGLPVLTVPIRGFQAASGIRIISGGGVG
jgi:hypothetical protein